MKKYLLLVNILIIIIAGILLLNNSKTIQKLKSREEFLSDKEYILKDNIKKSFSVETDKFNIEDLQNYSDSSYHSLIDRVKEYSTLVWLLPESLCNDCILQEYTKLKQLPVGLQQNIVLVTNYQRVRDLKLLLSSRKIQYPAYSHAGKIFADEMKKPVSGMLFVLDSLFVPQHIFIPMSVIPDMSDEYYSYLKESVFHVNEIYDIAVDTEKTEVTIPNKKHDLGGLKIGETVLTQFNIINKTPVPLLIYDIKTSCGCVAVDWSKEPINNGDSISIKIDFNAESAGYFSKRITVFSNTKDSPHQFIISGNVKNGH